MTEAIKDPEVRLLASIALLLKSDYEDSEDPWENSPFQWIKRLPSRQRGKVGEQIVSGWCAAKGLDVRHPPDQQADRIISGKRVEIKFSTLWKSGQYRFQQIRDQDYDHLLCLGISPFDAHMWVIPKSVLYRHVIGHTPQHRGREGKDTFWLKVDPNDIPAWLTPWGGNLSKAHEILRRL